MSDDGMVLRCEACDTEIPLDQPHPHHAGLGNQGFLYDDAGQATLVWSSFDPAYTKLVGDKHPWMLSSSEQRILEEALTPAPSGGRWRFKNPARCPRCHAPVHPPMMKEIHFLRLPGSPAVADGDLRSILRVPE